MSDIIPQKQCTHPDCKQWFPATTEFFHSNKQNKDGLCGYCKACKTAYVKAYSNSPNGHAKREAYRTSEEGQAKAYAHQKEYNQRPEVIGRNRIRDMERHRSPKRQEWLQDYNSRPETIERERAYMEVYRKEYYSQPENLEHKHEIDKHYHATHREQHIERGREYYETHKERHKELVRIYAETHSERLKETSRIRSHQYRAKKSAIPGTHTAEQIQDLLKRQKHKCYYCSVKFEQVKGKYIYHIDHTFPINRVAGTDIPANDISYLVLACPDCNMSKHDKYPWEFYKGGKLL